MFVNRNYGPSVFVVIFHSEYTGVEEFTIHKTHDGAIRFILNSMSLIIKKLETEIEMNSKNLSYIKELKSFISNKDHVEAMDLWSEWRKETWDIEERELMDDERKARMN